MKQWALLAGLLACGGCFTSTPEAIAPVAVPAPIRTAKAYPPITPEQITETNGHQVAQALEEELNREAQHNELAR